MWIFQEMHRASQSPCRAVVVVMLSLRIHTVAISFIHCDSEIAKLSVKSTVDEGSPVMLCAVTAVQLSTNTMISSVVLQSLSPLRRPGLSIRSNSHSLALTRCGCQSERLIGPL